MSRATASNPQQPDTAITPWPPRRSLARPRPLRILSLELRNELLKLLRMPGFVLPALGFPVMFYVLFGFTLPTPKASGMTMARYLLATYGAFGVLGVALFSLGAGMAIERGKGWTTARRAMAASTVLHLVARIAVAALFGAVVALALMVLGGTFGGVRMPTASWAALLAILTACAVPFGALGLAVGQFLSADSAPGAINLVYLPMSFLSGLWIPVEVLPKALQGLAEWLPPYHAAQLALRVLGGSREASPWSSVVYLAVLTVLCFVGASTAMRREGGARG